MFKANIIRELKSNFDVSLCMLSHDSSSQLDFKKLSHDQRSLIVDLSML